MHRTHFVMLATCMLGAILASTGACLAEAPFHERMTPVPETARFRDPDFFIWGASMVQDEAGVCHLFYSRWAKELGHNAWVTHSEIAHATSIDPLGPYTHVDVAFPTRGKSFWDGLCTHNPTVHAFEGKYYLYYMGNTGDGQTMTGLNWTHRNNQRIGVAVADHPNGPWRRCDAPLIDVGPDTESHDALLTSNPSICRRPDGKYLMVYKAVGRKRELPWGGPVVHLAATSDSPTGPFSKHPDPIFTAEGDAFPAEDPFIWVEDGFVWAIVKDMKGAFTGAGQSLALFRSEDGIDWSPAKHPLVSKLEIHWEGGETERVAHLERPQLWLRNGEPHVLFCAADKDREHAFNVHIPLKTTTLPTSHD
ncbi:glycoside hydrolase family protein [Novipirellula artificiosorum]|uniref:Glycosyl hydrolases family 43 n=1 Tax=Novipirellula artificiosorum TaxID=2528016 RepID=A0A5C6DWB9_9BACT|nr:glycoside hydrolase family protein [Novipirellula artificiosorum]TWU41030.1 Glycosyl hydrolases family 43 [Novipirellula artificiosorum]